MHVAWHTQYKRPVHRDVRRSGRWFPERGCILLQWQVQPSYDLASLFRGKRSTLDRWSGKIAKRIGARPSALHSTFHFWRKSRRIASFLMLSTWRIEEVSQNCSVFDVVNFKSWGSRRITAFSMLSTSKIEEVSQNSFFFKLADR